jgi:general secretion pathway protein M
MKSEILRIGHLLRSRWQLLGDREQLALLTAATLLVMALLWWVLLAPALHTLRTADSDAQRLDAQLIQMQQLQAQVRELKDRPPLRPEMAMEALQSSVRQRFGSQAQLQSSGHQITLTLKAAQAEALALWLTQARVNAHAHIVEAHLHRNPLALAQASWDGTLVLDLPAR